MDLLGDINRDGKIDKHDLELLRNVLKNASLFEHLSPEQKSMLDINGDGSVNYGDLVELIELIKMQIESHPDPKVREMRGSIDSLRNRLRQS